jgi:hypothetical protein
MVNDTELLKAIYKEKKVKYNELVDALAFAIETADRIRSLADDAQADMLATGEELLRAMGRLSE